MHHCNCLKNNQHDVTCGLSFIFMGSRHSFSTCFELSGSSSSGAEHVGEREGYSKDYTLYQRLTVQEKWSPDDELPESSKHVESEWRLPMKIKDNPQVTSCWLFLNNKQTFLCFGDTLHCKVWSFFLYKIRMDFSFRPVLWREDATLRLWQLRPDTLGQTD